MPDEHQITVVPPESVDAHTVSVLANQLAAIDGATEVLVDCHDVTFMDSSGLRALVSAHNRLVASGGSLRVVRPPRLVRRLLDIAGLERELLGDETES